MRPAAYVRSAAAGVLIAATLVAPTSPAIAASAFENFCNPNWPPAGTYDLLPSGSQLVTGSITGGDGGPWEVQVESEDQRRTAPQTTGPDGSFSIPVDPATPWISVGGVKLVIDGRWETGVNPYTPATIELPVSTSISVTALHPETGVPLPDARVLAYDLGIFEGAFPGGVRYLGRDDGAALIQDTTGSTGVATLPDIPVESSRVLLFACLDGQIDAIYADLSLGARAFTMPSDADGAFGAFEDEADGDRNGITDGDGNRDGLRDSLQSNVATLPSTVAGDLGSLVTIEAPAGTVLRNVTSSEPPIAAPPGSDLPFGLFGFRLTGIAPGSTHDITIYLPSLVGVAGYLKYLPDTQTWAAMPSDRVVVDGWRTAVVVTLTDGGIGDRDGLANGVIDDPGGPITGPSDSGDTNADGIPDALQPAGTPEFAFSDTTTTPPTYGRLVNANGLTGRIADAADPTKGVLVTVDPRTGGGSGPAELEVCGSVVLVDPGSQVVLTCGSVIVSPITGSATVLLDNGDTVTLPAGSSAEIEDTPDGVTLTNVSGGGVTVTSLNAPATVVLDNGDTVTLPAGSSAEIEDTPDGVTLTNVSGGGVTVTVDGDTVEVPDGEAPYAVNRWVFTGFAAPVDKTPVLNSGKAGRAVPLKWHLADTSGQPVIDLTTADITLTVENVTCGSGAIIDQLETTLTVGSSLQNLGNGHYQLNWKTIQTWAGSCKILTLDVGRGISKEARFTFTR